jgi:Zn-dependent protease with chaperone function
MQILENWFQRVSVANVSKRVVKACLLTRSWFFAFSPCILMFVIAFFLMTLSVCAAAAPSVKASSNQSASVKTAQRLARVLDHLLVQSNLNFQGHVQVIKTRGFSAAVVFGEPGHIQIGEAYANSLTDGELTFALSHELAHLFSDHQSRLKSFYAQDKPASTQTNQAQEYQPDQNIDATRLHHELELDADVMAMKWVARAGYTAADASRALERAYNGLENAFATHPVVKVRTALLMVEQ